MASPKNERLDKAIRDIFAIVRSLPSPREGAMALAGAHLHLFEAEGVTTEQAVRDRLEDSYKGTLEAWRGMSGHKSN